MKRVTVDGRWFDVDAAVRYHERTVHDGRNAISVNTGSQWDHETLYKTAKGRWVLRRSSDRQGVLPTWEECSPKFAAAWLILNGEDEAAHRHFPAEVAESEM